ncbi:MAG: hypothetical protein RLZZ574_3572, partial [Cyanobacteriota bacterium]
MEFGRRYLLKIASMSGFIATALAFSQDIFKPAFAQNKPTQAQIKKGEMLYRTLGSTGEEVSVIGVGGYHIG